jgi:hypothetical protein
LFSDVEALKEQVTALSTSYLTTTNEHRIDISQNLSKINDISNHRIVAIEQDITNISNNRITFIEQDITDISNNRITAIEQDITDISNNRITAIEQDITDISNNRITAIEQDITDLDGGKDFVVLHCDRTFGHTQHWRRAVTSESTRCPCAGRDL